MPESMNRINIDPEPRDYVDLPRDPELGLPVPFACGTPQRDAPATATSLFKRRVNQCALSRICGVCGAPLSRPLAFFGTVEEVGRNAFLFPACHEACAQRLADDYRDVTTPVFGQDEGGRDWQVVTASAYEFVRPVRGSEDMRPRFEPRTLLAD